ncbi:MAG: reverse transcriptase family protein [Planctomycetota bacterium]
MLSKAGRSPLTRGPAFVVIFAVIACLLASIPLVVWLVIRLQRVALLPYWRETHRRHRRRALRGKGLGVEELARRLDTTPQALATLDRRYHTFTVPKKRGGTRTLHAPNPALKRTQRLILRRLFRRLNAHWCATGFEPGVSIANNAAFHVGQAVVIKLDLKDFFPNTTADRVEAYFRRIGWDAASAALLTDLTTHEGGLPQGAPTSPRLSNLVNHVFDAQVLRYVEAHRGTYTRYADDLTISYPEDWPRYVRGTIQHVRRVAKRHGYTVHTRGKLRVVRQHQQQRVTGLVVNDKVNLTREKRRWLRAVEHRMRTTGRASLTPEQLAGWKALQAMVEQQRVPPPES